LNFDEHIYYEDYVELYGTLPELKSNISPDKSTYILNYAELKDKFDRWS